MSQLEGKTAVVTGVASGMGRATAELIVDGGGSAGRLWSETRETWNALEAFMTAGLDGDE